MVYTGTPYIFDIYMIRCVWLGATTATRTKSGTSVIRRSSVPPRAWVGPTTNWSQPETVAKSKAATP